MREIPKSDMAELAASGKQILGSSADPDDPTELFRLGIINPKIEETEGLTMCTMSLTRAGVIGLMRQCVEWLGWIDEQEQS